MQTVKGITQKKLPLPHQTILLKTKKPPNAFTWIGKGQEGLMKKFSNTDLRIEEHFFISS